MPVTSSHTVSYKSDYSLHHKDPHYLHLRWGWTFILCGMLNGCICHKAIAVHRLFGKCSGQNYQKMHKTVSNSSRNVHIYLRRFDWSMPPNCLNPKWVLIINYSNVEFLCPQIYVKTSCLRKDGSVYCYCHWYRCALSASW